MRNSSLDLKSAAANSSEEAFKGSQSPMSVAFIHYGHLYYPPLLLLLCLVGNSINFVVMGRVCTSSSIRVYFRWLAVADTLAALTFLSKIWLLELASLVITHLHDASCKLITFTNYTAGDVAIWLMVALTADRLVAVTRPLLSRRICGAGYAKLIALGISSCAALKNSTIMFSYAVVDDRCTYQTDHPLTEFERNIRPLLTLTFSGLVPVTVVVVLNFCVVIHLTRQKRIVRKLHAESENDTERVLSFWRRLIAANSRRADYAASCKKKSESTAISIVLANSFLFCVLLMPQFVLNVCKSVTVNEQTRIAQVFTTFLMYCNHSGNFYVSYAASAEYRKKVYSTLMCSHAESTSRRNQISTIRF